MALVGVFFFVAYIQVTDTQYIKPCRDENSHFCSRDVLEKVQMSGIYKDSKTFVDMPLKQNWTTIIKEDILNASTTSELRSKLDKYFYPAGKKEWYPKNVSDWKEHPKILEKIADSNYKKWAKHLCGLWQNLVREINVDVSKNNQRYSMIYLKEPLVVPGGRFREIYYWDTFWSIEGLLHCEMYTTTRGVLENLLQLVNLYGFVPNGGRKYYENRSQPPFLTLMVLKYWEVTGDSNFVKKHHSTLMKEYEFWMKERVVSVNITSSKQYNLNRYFCKLGFPRPESFKEDVELVNHSVNETDINGQEEMYSHIATAAESGWDFSSRWFGDFKTMGTIKTSDIIPVDLNSILCAVEFSLAYLTEEVMKNSSLADTLLRNAKSRRVAIDEFFWSEPHGLWLDYDIKKKMYTKQFYSSSIFPLWIDNFDRSGATLNTTRRRFVFESLNEKKILSFPGGLPTSLINSGQQWDFPNAWAPLQHVAVYSFDTINNETTNEMKDEGKMLAKKFLENAYLTWTKNGHMFEKYDVEHPGKEGHGGEYKVQLGFGWTNGVVLDFLGRYGHDLTAPSSTANSSDQTLFPHNYMLLYFQFFVYYFLFCNIR